MSSVAMKLEELFAHCDGVVLEFKSGNFQLSHEQIMAVLGAINDAAPDARPMRFIQLSEIGFAKLRDFLEAHEDDIKLGNEDYDELRPVFKQVIGRSPGELSGDRDE